MPKQKFQGTPVGGLSALTYDHQRNLLYAISDDRSELAPARFYTLKLNLDAANPKTPKIKQIDVTGVTFITDEAGQPYAKGEVDPEGIVLSSLGTLFISSEGIAPKGIAPFVREFDLKTGEWKRSLLIPDRYLPKTEDGKQTQGVGDNLGFESLTLNMSGGSTVAIEPFRLFTATESALMQDVSPEHPQQGASRNRVLYYSLDPTYSLLLSEHLYEMAPPPEGALFHGLTDMLAIDQGGHFISMERSFGSNGFGVKLFQLATGSA
ncbi:MAG: esterase-like activity of phytase family protein, partial [Leptolyngbyaceae cyanobacterium CAN_BIN12]|nr:esterase-like activity of phytase family protein [Leptolyngbyaceae cyanobacterium CAN_BIN12]